MSYQTAKSTTGSYKIGTKQWSGGGGGGETLARSKAFLLKLRAQLLNVVKYLPTQAVGSTSRPGGLHIRTVSCSFDRSKECEVP